MPSIVIATPSLVPNDAVGNDVLIQKKYLEQSFFKPPVYLYAENIHSSYSQYCISEKEVLDHLSCRSNTLIYHHSVYWPKIDSIIKLAHASVVMKYHNITPDRFFRDYDKLAAYFCAMGRQQTRSLLPLCTGGVLSDSEYNAAEVNEIGEYLPRSFVIPPFVKFEELECEEPCNDLLAALQKNTAIKLLFVGRVAPNKGHRHLVKALARYIELFGNDIELNIVGGKSPGLVDYYLELEELIGSYGIGEHINFLDHLAYDELLAYYQGSDIFLCLSEHEGFCVPILEAQKMSLPVVAVDCGAVKDTLGEGQLCFDDFDYDVLATAINEVCKREGLKQSLIKAGHENILRYDASVTAKRLVDCLYLSKETAAAKRNKERQQGLASGIRLFDEGTI